jgi:hypothetical protein
MSRKTEVLAAVIMAALVQILAGCINQGDGVAPPVDKAQPAEGEGVALPVDKAQPAEGDGVAPPEAKPPFPADTQDIQIPRLSIADREGWSADAFFTAPNELQICQVISSGDQERLSALLDSGVELNTPGKFGFTLLYWAYVEDSFEAFELLLKHGADPDHRLTDTFRWSEDGLVETEYNKRGARYFIPFVTGNSIFFTSLWQMRPEYCIAALKYTKNVNQLDRGENLLHRFLQPGVAYKRGLRALIKAGVDLNAKGRFGCTPCHLAVTFPSMCVELLEAGADPSIKNDRGFDVAEVLEHELASLREHHVAEVDDPLINWFRENGREIHPHDWRVHQQSRDAREGVADDRQRSQQDRNAGR